MKQYFFLFIVVFLFGYQLFAQSASESVASIYKDYVTELVINSDGTFLLKNQYDPIFFFEAGSYSNAGQWKWLDAQKIVLNPEKIPRTFDVQVEAAQFADQDSITLEIHYWVEVFENEDFVRKEVLDFERLAIFINKKKKVYNLVKALIWRGCSFAPKIKNQLVLDRENKVKISQQNVESIGIFRYESGEPYEIKITNPNANYFKINIIHQIDAERTPRRKEVILKKKRAYFYEHKGEVSTAWFISPLVKQ